MEPQKKPLYYKSLQDIYGNPPLVPIAAVGEFKNLHGKANALRSPEIDIRIQLRWGLTLLGEQRAEEYLSWLQKKIRSCHS